MCNTRVLQLLQYVAIRQNANCTVIYQLYCWRIYSFNKNYRSSLGHGLKLARAPINLTLSCRYRQQYQTPSSINNNESDNGNSRLLKVCSKNNVYGKLPNKINASGRHVVNSLLSIGSILSRVQKDPLWIIFAHL